jgi:NADP-dependent 3-hydroxy acid dehydrogenase YdfG
MKIAITGHTAGIGQAFTKILQSRGHEIIGISRRTGENIKRIEHVANMIQPCDMFINNAQTGYAQTELLYAVWGRWQGVEGKYIWNISTQMTESPVNSIPDDQNDLTMSAYRNQKIALEDASQQLRYKKSWPVISIIRPGAVATQENFSNVGKCNVDEWAKLVVDTFTNNTKIYINEISLVPTSNSLKL